MPQAAELARQRQLSQRGPRHDISTLRTALRLGRQVCVRPHPACPRDGYDGSWRAHFLQVAALRSQVANLLSHMLKICQVCAEQAGRAGVVSAKIRGMSPDKIC